MTIHLNAGNLFDFDYLFAVIALNKKYKDVQVKSLFGSIAALTPTARAIDRLPYCDWAFLDRYIHEANKAGISTRWTLNASCIGSVQEFKKNWDGKLKEDVQELHNIGVHEWIVTSPLLVELLRNMFPEDFIEVSTIVEVATADQARHWQDLGADGVNISTSINRDFPTISSIADTDIKVSILANEACLFNCPWRRECYNLSSHNSQRSDELFGFYPFSRCNAVRFEHPEEWIKARMVLPQWMSFYQEVSRVNWFKIAYRTHPKEVGLPMLEAYMSQNYEGNLLDLWPTIAVLGNTDEPKEKTYISCKKIDDLKFLSQIFVMSTKQKQCSRENCGDSCKFCHYVYNYAKK